MQLERLFDRIANAHEEERVSSHEFRKPILLPWTMDEERTVFRRSAVSGLAAKTEAEYEQITTLSRARLGFWGGFINPMEHLNASYAFAEQEQMLTDHAFLAKHGGNSLRVPEDLTAQEWILQLSYKRLGDFNCRCYLQRAQWKPRIRPQFSPALPMPSPKTGGEWRCIASGGARDALAETGGALAAGEVPLVLITGAPGSGKDAYASALHYGRRQHWNSKARCPKKAAKASYRVISLAGIDQKTLDSDLQKVLPELKERGGTIFFDEADKAAQEIRSRLLRLFEQKSYKIKDKDREFSDVAFIVGAGKELTELRDLEPPDFWTRMEIHVEVADPLAAASNLERDELLADFFRHFWWDASSTWLEGVLRGDDTDSPWDEVFDRDRRARPYAEEFFKHAIGTVGDYGVLVRSPAIDELASLFAEFLSPHLARRRLSVRGLRSCVKAIAWEVGSPLLGLVAMPGAESALEQLRKTGRRAVAEAIGTVLQVLPA